MGKAANATISNLFRHDSIEAGGRKASGRREDKAAAAAAKKREVCKPAWLEALDKLKFFASCSVHENARKNEKNVCCLDCCTAICPHCLRSHRRHRLVQIRRYVYHDVVRLQDLDKLIDCSSVQSYTINSSKVIFLKKRPQSRQFKGSGNVCTSCDRTLQEPYIHCSLECKVDYISRHTKDFSQYLRTCQSLELGPDFMIPQDHIGEEDDANETTQSTIVEGDEDPMCSSESENYFNVPYVNFIRKKRSGLNICWRSANRVSNDEYLAANMSRRKGIPQRSPLC
ncbi:hypothetical protein Cni_G00299 [Canna indica]|uniref:B box-type domain-containing protein n=1 Tax=Canna indica TaxID=4628 RepID=A0AAQ3JKX2_9LILI|nr:hypothetical protein Cni_G00299 [Canna indica]